MSDLMKRFRGHLIALTPSTNDAIDGQQLCKSEQNGNYYLRIGGMAIGDAVMISAQMAAGWLTVHGLPQRDDTVIWTKHPLTLDAVDPSADANTGKTSTRASSSAVSSSGLIREGKSL